MPVLAKVRSFLRNTLLSRRVDADLDLEVHSHLELLAEENGSYLRSPTAATVLDSSVKIPASLLSPS